MKITLANLHLATAQQVFDQVVGHLRKQGEKSQIRRPNFGDTDCQYRNPEGLMCAAGCLIADDEYDPNMEGQTWSGVVMDHNISNNHKDLISLLQRIHDNSDVGNWERRFEGLAADSGLIYTPLCKEV